MNISLVLNLNELHLSKFYQNGFSIQLLQVAASRYNRSNIGSGGFSRFHNCLNLLLLWSFRQSASSPIMPKFSIFKLCKFCDGFVSNMKILHVDHVFIIFYSRYWSLVKDYSCCLAAASEFYFAYCGLFIFENSLCQKERSFA